MSGLSNARVIVAGAGAFGSTVALRLAQAGASVVLADPRLEGSGAGCGASGVAAGMLAPAFEVLLDPETGLSFDLLRDGRDLWSGLADRLRGGPIGLSRAGAVWLDLPGLEPRAEAIAAGMDSIGARRAPPPLAALRLVSAEAISGAAVFTPEDWRLGPRAALTVLHSALIEAGGQIAGQGVITFEGGQARLSGGGTVAADHLVVAAGAEGAGLAPELADLVPIKGQILKYPDLIIPPGTPALRCVGGYAVGGADGLCVGATMEAGRRDLEIDAAVAGRLRALAERLYPEAAGMTPVAQAGVRAASRDGRPMIGPSAAPGVWLAAGARRNGWLLGPLVAEIIASYLAGRDPGPHATPLEPGRFAAAES
ncbi:MAG: FAD-dependent oxidoreductase [Caulobacteraceae bacterium]|nr:FAD-dependent oxidoreductase [Caulobacteraceae bacterium]